MNYSALHLDLLGVLIAVLTSWQLRTVVALVLIDLVLGVASALKRGAFHWSAVANFYITNVIPYVLGYVVLYLAITYIMPSDVGGIDLGPLTPVAITIAWGFVAMTLVSSIRSNFEELYRPPVPPAPVVIAPAPPPPPAT